MSRRGDDWVEFAALTLKHIDEYTVPQYGDAPDDPAEEMIPEDFVRAIGRYVARFGRNARGPEEQRRDMLKIAHYAQMAHDKLAKAGNHGNS